MKTNPKSLQRQHGYKFKVQNKLNRNFINFDQCITRFKHRIKNIFTKNLNQTINQSIANPKKNQQLPLSLCTYAHYQLLELHSQLPFTVR